MRILQINATAQSGSTGRSCYELQAYVNDHTPHTCFTACAEGEENAHTFVVGGSVGHRVHGLLSRIDGRQSFHSRFATDKLLRRVDELNIDTVLLGNLHGNYIHLPKLMAHLALRDIVTVVRLDDCWPYTGKCCHYTLDGCYRWKQSCGSCPRLGADNPSWGIDATSYALREKRRLYSSVPRLGVIGVSDWILSEARQSILSCASCMQRIYNWIDLAVFTPDGSVERVAPVGIGSILAVASDWSEAKGLSMLFELATRLGQSYRVGLIGRIPSHYVLPENVVALGEVRSPSVLAAWYRGADVFVNASLEESFGKVAAEALACGTPVVCFDSTANAEICGQGCGFVCRRGDVDAAVHAVKELCGSPHGEYRKGCREYATANFERVVNIERYLSFFERVHARGNQSSPFDENPCERRRWC